MTVRRGIDPREFLLVTGGGATGQHAAQLAKELGMKKIVFPKTAPVLCAMGMLNANINFSYVGSKYTDTKNFDFDGVNAVLESLSERAREALDREGIPEEQRRFEYYVAARYPMQVSELDMPLKGSLLTPEMISELESDFHSLHEKRYTVNDPTSYVECTDWRVLGIGVLPDLQLQEQTQYIKDASKALKGKRRAYFVEAGGFTEALIYDGERLTHGMEVNGPAIIEDRLTTTVVIPESKITVNKVGSYIMELS